MFTQLLIAKAFTSIVIVAIVLRFFREPIHRILTFLVGSDFVSAWIAFIRFGAFVLAISGGVDLFRLDVLTRKDGSDYQWAEAVTIQRWAFEIFSTAMQVLSGLAFAFLVFFIISLVLVARSRMIARGKPDTHDVT